MEKKEYILDGYAFRDVHTWERAKKEKETIAYLEANTGTEDVKAVYKLYMHAVEKCSFQTVIGLKYMEKLRRVLLDANAISEEALPPIPVLLLPSVQKEDPEEKFYRQNLEKRVAYYKEEVEKEKAGKTIKNFLVGILLVVIVAMLVITLRSKYSVFTYFTNYKEYIRNEVIDEMENWQNQLEEREEKLEKREKQLEEAEK